VAEDAEREWSRGEFLISMDRGRLDLDAIHEFLARSYWGQGRSRERVARAIEHSTPFGLYRGREQVGFARVLTDYVSFALLADVFVLEQYRGRGLGTWLVETVTSHSEFRAVRRFHLGTADAHGLYQKFGFSAPEPGRFLDRVNPDCEAEVAGSRC